MKNKNIVLQDLLVIIKETFKIETDGINMTTTIFDGGISLDSIQLIEFTVAIEKFYGFQFSDEELTEENFWNFDLLTNLIIEILERGNK